VANVVKVGSAQEVISVRTQVDVLALQIDDAVLAAVLEQVTIGRNAVISQQTRVTIRAACVQQIRQELNGKLKNEEET
jgi:hypothetical protein